MKLHSMQFNTGYLHEFFLTVLLTVLEFFSSFSDFSFRVFDCEKKLLYHENYQIQLRRGIHTAGTSVKDSLVIHYIDNKDKTSTSGIHFCKHASYCCDQQCEGSWEQDPDHPSFRSINW
ncbi:hypothetical protein KC19_10G174400 [Ceratodon purpureus]|uniref:Uncharacterized protein n=1 Tax=Ceratodon purpureus TaxID=3225 RepID=A0A8T0GLE1_CERPU|nr:hypothetical protein KC19_10G174400 [Ceratodon purpureus]